MTNNEELRQYTVLELAELMASAKVEKVHVNEYEDELFLDTQIHSIQKELRRRATVPQVKLNQPDICNKLQ
jgi:hypothetical protein